jgi:HPt (histidine-containing phosphotransfer) domain-containing protein
MARPYLHIVPAQLYSASGDDLAMFRHMSRIFIDSAPAMFERILAASEAAAAAGAGHPLIAACHALRGVTVLVGAHALSAPLIAFERQAAQGAAPSAAALEAVRLQLLAVCAEVARSVEEYAGAAP